MLEVHSKTLGLDHSLDAEPLCAHSTLAYWMSVLGSRSTIAPESRLAPIGSYQEPLGLETEFAD